MSFPVSSGMQDAYENETASDDMFPMPCTDTLDISNSFFIADLLWYLTRVKFRSIQTESSESYAYYRQLNLLLPHNKVTPILLVSPPRHHKPYSSKEKNAVPFVGIYLRLKQLLR